jgi:phosphoglycolate phosphatase
MLQELMAGLGVEPAQTLMVGDTEYDMEMAARAGTHALAASYGVHDRERLQRWPLRGFLDDIADLPRWWQAQQSGPEAN